jgi:hypothetical protein
VVLIVDTEYHLLCMNLRYFRKAKDCLREVEKRDSSDTDKVSMFLVSTAKQQNGPLLRLDLRLE